MKRFIQKIMLLAALTGCGSCTDWLDVVPDGIATIDMAFKSRTQAVKYLATCYSYLPKNGRIFLGTPDPAMMGADEFYGNPNAVDNAATGTQSKNMTASRRAGGGCGGNA